MDKCEIVKDLSSFYDEHTEEIADKINEVKRKLEYVLGFKFISKDDYLWKFIISRRLWRKSYCGICNSSSETIYRLHEYSTYGNLDEFFHIHCLFIRTENEKIQEIQKEVLKILDQACTRKQHLTKLSLEVQVGSRILGGTNGY